MLVGRDPRDITALFERLVKHSFWPLLGGRVRERVRVYAHVGSSIPNFKHWPIEPQAYGNVARDLIDRGYEADPPKPSMTWARK